MHSAAHTITAFVLEKISGEPLRKRAELYRALAELTPSNEERKSLLALALECEAIAAAHDQVVFSFLNRTGDGDGMSGGNGGNGGKN